MIFILLLTFIPKHDIPDLNLGFKNIDKLVHFSFYFILINIFLKESNDTIHPRVVWIGFFCCILLGIGTEYGQAMMHLGRNFEWADMTANTLGNIVGFFFFKVLLKDKTSGKR